VTAKEYCHKIPHTKEEKLEQPNIEIAN